MLETLAFRPENADKDHAGRAEGGVVRFITTVIVDRAFGAFLRVATRRDTRHERHERRAQLSFFIRSRGAHEKTDARRGFKTRRARERKKPPRIDEISMKREELEGGRSLKKGAGWRRHNIALSRDTGATRRRDCFTPRRKPPRYFRDIYATERYEGVA